MIQNRPMSRGYHRFIRPFSQKQPLQLPEPHLTASECEAFREAIELGLSQGRNAVAIWQDLVTEYGGKTEGRKIRTVANAG